MDIFLEWLQALAPYAIAIALVLLVVIGSRFLKAVASTASDPSQFGIDDLASIAVLGVESMLKDEAGNVKYDAAVEWIKKYYPDVDEEDLRMLIQAAYTAMVGVEK